MHTHTSAHVRLLLYLLIHVYATNVRTWVLKLHRNRTKFKQEKSSVHEQVREPDHSSSTKVIILYIDESTCSRFEPSA